MAVSAHAGQLQSLAAAVEQAVDVFASGSRRDGLRPLTYEYAEWQEAAAACKTDAHREALRKVVAAAIVALDCLLALHKQYAVSADLDAQHFQMRRKLKNTRDAGRRNKRVRQYVDAFCGARRHKSIAGRAMHQLCGWPATPDASR